MLNQRVIHTLLTGLSDAEWMIFLEDLPKTPMPQPIGLDATLIQKPQKQFPNPVCGHGLSLLESQNLLD
jgi:hypothetical protein